MLQVCFKQNYWKPLDNGNGKSYWVINRNNNERVDDRVVGYASVEYDIIDDLTLLVRSQLIVDQAIMKGDIGMIHILLLKMETINK